MQIVNILCDQQELVKILFQFHQSFMCGIWLNLQQLSPASLVKAPDQFRIPLPCERRRHILNSMIFPQSIRCTKCLDSGFSTNSGPSQDDNTSLFVKSIHHSPTISRIAAKVSGVLIPIISTSSAIGTPSTPCPAARQPRTISLGYPNSPDPVLYLISSSE